MTTERVVCAVIATDDGTELGVGGSPTRKQKQTNQRTTHQCSDWLTIFSTKGGPILIFADTFDTEYNDYN